MKRIYLLLLIFLIVFVDCKKNKEAEISTFSIQNEEIIPASTSMMLSCKVVCSATIKDLYLQYGTKADFSKCEEVRMKNNGDNHYSATIDSLAANTTYYVRYLAVNSYSSMTSEKISKFKTLVNSDPGNQFEPEYVDLGLSVKWATCNVGATKPEEYGDYFAWGETEPKEKYDWSTYKYGSNMNALTKYCSDSEYGNNGFIDNKIILDPEDDAAHVNWGGAWRMPTDAELTELREKCKWTWTSQNEVNGYKVVGPNGNSIFLPAAGYKDGESLLITRSFGNYWSSSLHTDYSDLAYSVYFYSDVVDKYGSNRDHGRSVRPVWGGGTDDPTTNNKYTITVSANSSSYGTVSGGGTYEEGTQVTLTATANSGYKFVRWSDGNTDNPRVITVTQDKSYTAYFEKFEPEYVDLGLPSGLKWATCNVGATKPEEYGDYFAWGEVEPKEKYDWSTYKYGSNMNALTKYCSDSEYGNNGFIDNKIILDPEDDAATVNWGGAWRMPTRVEQQELIDNCTWTWITQNGVNGYKVVGANGNSIFLPAAEGIDGTYFDQDGSEGHYWSSSLFTNYPNLAYFLFFNSSRVYMIDYFNYFDRYPGFTIRPVYGGNSDNLEKNKYTITVSSNSTSYGTVSGGGTYEEGTQATLTATPKAGYKFTEWHDGNTDNPRVITVSKEGNYVVRFEKVETLQKNRKYYYCGFICQGEIYNQHGFKGLYHTGEYYIPFKSKNGCDSLVYLNLVVLDKDNIFINQKITTDDLPFMFWNKVYDENTLPGSYNDIILVEREGCASTISYTLEIEKSKVKQYTITASSNNSSYGTVSGGGTYEEGTQVTLTATANSGYKFVRWNDGNTENPRVITVTQDESYTAYFEVEVTMNAGHEYVDLGLPSGLKWATCNVGATKPEDYGDYFAWGEVEPKEYYDWSTYKYSSDYDELTKYCNKSSYGKDGFTDNKTVLDPEDDAAHVNWGGAWRMPTLAEQQELKDNCTWTWTTQNSVNGYKVVGPNGRSIFLPAAGYMYEGSLYDAGSRGLYWSSSLNTDDPNRAFSVNFLSGYVSRYDYNRFSSHSVRPVCQ